MAAVSLAKSLEDYPDKEAYLRRFSRGRKLSEEQVKMIRESSDKFLCLASEFKVSTRTISQIRSGKIYTWVK
jgi:hypothetical protein